MIAIRKNAMTLGCLALLVLLGTSDIYSQEKTRDHKEIKTWGSTDMWVLGMEGQPRMVRGVP